jgi:hypothetical protein
MSCFAGTCLDLNDVYAFITKIKDLDLYGYAHPKQCCADGAAYDPTCNCEDGARINGVAREDACIFSYCFSWAEMFAKMAEVNTAYKSNELVPFLVMTAGGLLTWLGYKGETVFAAHLPTFWKSTGSLITITSGIFSATYAGYATVDAAVKSEYWTASSKYKGSAFLGYGGNGWLSGTLGAFEVTWVILFLSLGIEIVLAPFYIAQQMDMYYAAKYEAANTVTNKAQFDWFALGLAFLTAFGGWTSAVALKNSTTTLINYFDITNTDSATLYTANFGSGSSIDNSIALLIDLLNHTGIVSFYYILAAVISNCAYWFAYTTIQAQNQ